MIITTPFMEEIKNYLMSNIKNPIIRITKRFLEDIESKLKKIDMNELCKEEI